MPSQQPFILDVTYRDKLDFDAWRQHYCRLERHDPGTSTANAVTITVMTVLFAAAGPVLLGFAYFYNSGLLYGLGAFAGVFGLIAAVACFFLTRSMRAESEAFRRMAQQLVLVEGELTDCKSEMGTDSDGDVYYFVTASYRAVAPGGKEVKGWKRHDRDDLHNQPLPAPGMPVLVMTLPDGSRAAML